MKKFTKAGAKFAAAVAMSVLAMGYTTSVWAEDIKDSYTATGLDIDNGEQLNISEKNGLFIGCQAIAKKNAEGIGINVNGAQADFDINGHFGVLAQGCIEGTEANVSIKAVGFSGEKGSSLIKAGSVGYVASNEDHRGISTGTLVEESLGMALNNYAMNIFAEKDINIYSFILNNTELTSKKTAQGMVLSNASKASLQAGGQIRIEVDSMSNSKLEAINAKDSKLDMKAEQGIEIKAANIDAEGNVQADKVYAIVADNSEIALDGGSSGIYILGNVNVSNNSVLKLSGVTGIGGTRMRIGRPGSNLTVENSTLVVDGLVTTSGTTTLNNAKIYMYDANNAEDAFHTLSIKNLDIAGSNELFLRADSSKDSDVNRGGLNSDVIGISDIGTTITEKGKFDVHVLDKGMKTGYGMGADGEKILDNTITVLYNRDGNVDLGQLVNSVKVTNYDNGIWRYAYEMNAVSDGNKVVIKNVNVTAAPSASGSQRSLHSANKAAGALAIGVLGNDSALHAHLREAQGAGEREEVWAQYLGGNLKSDGMQLKHNGVELGYDAYVGNNWTFGVSGMQTRGNTQLDSGSGKAKTNVGTVYGAWHGGSTYLNLEAKAGRVSSESKAFGGTVMQKIAGEFSAPAYSVSAEYGSTHELPAAWYLEPAVRLSYVHLGAADYSVRTQETLARVANDSFDSIILRGGAKLGRRLGAKGSFYVKAAAVYDFGGDLATTVSADGRTAHYEDSLGGWGVEYAAGMEYKLGKAANISLDVERRSGGELKRDWGINVGVNYSF
ncbi:autotransporter outer membrane beta-barrel domain-containing protein [uncultured Phascolarctobacterium sp.]|uniref:autotransporter outer membrane beta-barrel domain-containing protein n=1 Tax=uncultured Phascolarctobacterium sp. TaxID=512296 RepID=UPI0026376FF7|nr:autotransporter outer membrane beta-barrel domain-containing protein [uncultured Phascolarctobacterium sp.]